jgi:integrase
MLALLRSSIDLQRREIIVKGETTKNARTRRVPMLPRTLDLVTEMLATPPRSLYLFHRPDGNRHSEKTRNVRRGLLIGAERAGIADLTWHDLRRTCGCRLLQDYKMPLHEVSAWLGHSDVKLTAKRYAFLGTDALHDRIAETPILKLVKG